MSRTRSWARPRAAIALAATFALSGAMFATASTAHATPESDLAAQRQKAEQLEAHRAFGCKPRAVRRRALQRRCRAQLEGQFGMDRLP